MLYRLARHFQISQKDAQAMNGNQFTRVNRLAWCNAFFVKAGAVVGLSCAHHHAIVIWELPPPTRTSAGAQ